ncbi:MAG: flagellar hook-associated protein FlgK [Desulfobacterales bacterium]
MPDIYGIMTVASQSLLAQQKAIDVTGQNIANVNTPGYSRQRVVLEPNTPIYQTPGQMGTGVKAVQIKRVYDRFIGAQINDKSQDLGRWEAQESALQRIEILFDETDGTGLQNVMSDYWNAWQDLASNPSGYTERVTLRGAGEVLTSTFNDLSENLTRMQQDFDTQIVGTLEDVNRLGIHIADLNHKIGQIEVTGQTANDYRDQREALLKELSSLIDIDAFENDDGQVNVMIGNGQPLVNGTFSWSLQGTLNTDGLHAVSWLDGNENAVDVTDHIQSGRLKGWLDARDHYVSDYRTRLDELASGIISKVNEIHASGFGLTVDPVSGEPYTGTAFFDGDSAASIAVSGEILGDVNRIAAAATAAGSPGDNSRAVDIAELQFDLAMSGNSASFDDFYNSLVSDVGNHVRQSTANRTFEGSMLSQMEAYRESVSGVNLDEEMINLLKFQHAYEAAAKMITTADEMLQTVMNMV